MTDATYVKTRDTGRVVSVVAGVYSDGRREVFDMVYGFLGVAISWLTTVNGCAWNAGLAT